MPPPPTEYPTTGRGSWPLFHGVPLCACHMSVLAHDLDLSGLTGVLKSTMQVIRPISRGSGGASQLPSISNLNLNLRPASAVLKAPMSSNLLQPRTNSKSILTVVSLNSPRSPSLSPFSRPASAARSGSGPSLVSHMRNADVVPPFDVWRNEDVAADLLPS